MSVKNDLYGYLSRCENNEGRKVVNEAISLIAKHPTLSAPELIRLAYWGASGVEPNPAAAPAA